MATQCEDITCPDSCLEPLPNVKFKVCNPEFNFGQISDCYLANPGYPLTDETDPTEWAARMALDDSDPAKIIRLVGIGSMPVPESNSVDASHGRKAYGTRDRSIIFKIDEVSDENYEFMRKTECGKSVLVWPKTLNGKAFGGPSGILATMDFGHEVPESAADLENLQGTFTWKSKISPCRFDHPLQGDTSDLES